MTKTKEQFRGHCQSCGRQQAVINGRMAHHGYRVAGFGYFVGTCSGRDHAPMEKDRAHTDAIAHSLRSQADADATYAVKLAAREVDPEFIVVERQELKRSRSGYSHHISVPYDVPYCYGNADEQERARRQLVARLESNVIAMRNHADMLQTLATKVHGKKLMKIGAADKPAAINTGEKRAFENGVVVVCTYVDGPRVHWKRADTGRTGWTGTRAWRAMKQEA